MCGLKDFVRSSYRHKTSDFIQRLESPAAMENSATSHRANSPSFLPKGLCDIHQCLYYRNTSLCCTRQYCQSLWVGSGGRVCNQTKYTKRRKSISRKRGFTKPWVLKKRISAAKSAENVAFGPKPSSSTQILRSGAGLGARPGLEPGPDPGLAGPRRASWAPKMDPKIDPILTLF